MSFKGENTPRGNLLSWATASEQNNAGFDVEKSIDGVRFEKIGFVKGNGTTQNKQNYSFEDILPLESSGELVYYRLLQKDFSGKTEYSTIISI